MTNNRRQDPDELLKQVTEQAQRAARGRLKIFLGASPGVGKTYAMLLEGHEQRSRGIDVLVGYVETHGRQETEALLDGSDILAPKSTTHRGVKLKEFDIDGALRRKPIQVLVDELAHTNAPGSRHPKRWQDVEELLQAGIDVLTTVNIQHFESLNDVVAQITGVQVRETIPDSILGQADEVELVDIPPDELIQRLREGKVYVAERIEQALDGFFRKGNLIAMRELALRRTADRVDAQMQSFRSEHRLEGLWPTRERVLVCIAPNRLADRVVRAAGRIGATSHAELVALYVESDRQQNRSPEEHERAMSALRLAESLGIETVTVSGHDIVGELLRFAEKRNANLIVVGKPIKPRWKEVLFGSVVDELVRRSGEINVYVITGEAEGTTTPTVVPKHEKGSWQSYGATLAICALASAISFAMFRHVALANLIMVYLLGVAFVASRFGPREAALASLLSVIAFDLFFVPPRNTLAVSDTQYIFTFGVMLGVALLISSLTLRVRRQAEHASEREQRSLALYTLSRELNRSGTAREIGLAAARKIREVFDVDAAVLLPSERGSLAVAARSLAQFERDRSELNVAQWAYDHGETAGLGTNTLPGSKALYLPLRGSRGPVGILALKPSHDVASISLDQRGLFETFANGMAVAIERSNLATEAQTVRLQAETEKMRSSLLSSVSHDLRTPLTAISGAAGTLVQSSKITDPKLQDLARTILEESERLNRMVRNLLDMTRLESGSIVLALEWQSLEEIVGSAVNRTEELMNDHRLDVYLDPTIPLIKMDGVLFEQALINILENAARYTPEESTIQLAAARAGGYVRIEVSDNGTGIPAGEEEIIFEKFYQPRGRNESGGFGLGLAICRAIMQAHGGRAWAANRDGAGASFFLEMPVPTDRPEVPRG